MGALVPQLGSHGWVSDDDTKLDLLLGYFYTADYRQTYLYPGHVTSLPRIMQERGMKAAACASSIQLALSDYLAPYFSQVEVHARLDDDNVTDKSVIYLEIGYVSSKAKKTALRALQPGGGIFANVVRISNTGE